MFLNGLFCLWGSAGDKSNISPSDYVDKGSGASSVAIEGERIASRQSSGGLSHESADSAEPIKLSPYYYQHKEQLDLLSGVYERNPNDPGVCKAIANVLKELGSPDENEDCADIIADLEGDADTLTFINLNNGLELFGEQYNNACLSRNKLMNEESLDRGILDIAPLTYWRVKGSYYAAIGQRAKSQSAFAKYQALQRSLVAWVSQFIEEYKKKHSAQK